MFNSGLIFTFVIFAVYSSHTPILLLLPLSFLHIFFYLLFFVLPQMALNLLLIAEHVSSSVQILKCQRHWFSIFPTFQLFLLCFLPFLNKHCSVHDTVLYVYLFLQYLYFSTSLSCPFSFFFPLLFLVFYHHLTSLYTCYRSFIHNNFVVFTFFQPSSLLSPSFPPPFSLLPTSFFLLSFQTPLYMFGTVPFTCPPL